MSQISASYQKTADTLRKAASEGLQPRDPARNLLIEAANQLENAADTARLLEEMLFEDEGTMRRSDPENAGQWEGQRDADLRRARGQGITIGLAIAMIAMAIAAVLF